nr:MAG TPA: hypothetical protein [Bacteriophage sp.]
MLDKYVLTYFFIMFLYWFYTVNSMNLCQHSFL